MKSSTILVLTLLAITGAFGQAAITLTFTAIDSAGYVQMDSIRVMNRTQGSDTVLYYPDTILVLDILEGIHEGEIEAKGFEVFQNYPNPVNDKTTIFLYIPEKDEVILVVTDLLGRVILKTDHVLERSTHFFCFRPGDGKLFFFTAEWRGINRTVKILYSGNKDSGTASLEYMGSDEKLIQKKNAVNLRGFSYTSGDMLLFVGYYDWMESGMPDTPEESMTYTFQFATNIPCPGTPTVEYEGQVYHTIQVFSQCWLKENLNVGEMIPGILEQLNNGTIEKYCYENDPDSCTKYGGLYQWDEMMQYTNLQNAQGICPPGWHLPADEEWKVLEGAADSHYGIGDPAWDSAGGRGSDAGNTLRTIEGWYNNEGGTDLFGVSMMPGGYRKFDATFHGAFYNGEWWSSTEVPPDIAWRRRLNYGDMKIFRNDNSFKEYGFSVRCLRNDFTN